MLPFISMALLKFLKQKPGFSGRVTTSDKQEGINDSKSQMWRDGME